MLFTPGPVDVHPEVLAAAAKPPLHHRSPEFLELSQRIWSGLARVFQTDGLVSIVPGSGMSGIEAAISSLHPTGASVLIFSHGRFGERLRTIAQTYGLSVIYRPVPWGETITVDQVEEALRSHPYVDGVWLVHAETSTAVALDLEALIPSVKRMAPGALIGLDVVTSLGVQPFAMDARDIDIAVTGLQKGLACVPGAGVVALSQRAMSRLETAEPPTYTLDLRRVVRNQSNGLFTWTPPVTLLAALDAALELLERDGLETRWQMHRERHTTISKHCADLGLETFGDATAMGVVAVAHDRADEIRAQLREVHDLHLAGGQDQLAGTILRIGTMGHRSPDDVPRLLDALQSTVQGLS